MKTILLTTALSLLSIWVTAQKDPIALEYSIGAFRIPANLDRQINDRFAQLDANQTYTVTIVGSADFLGSADNNQVLSNKRVKFAEYHLLKKYRNLRLIIKLDSKGELYAGERAKTRQGVQAHRMVYIYIDDYGSGARAPNPIVAHDQDGFNGRTIATAAATQAENLKDVAVSVSPSTPRSIQPISETAQIEIAKQKQESIERQLRDALTDRNTDHGGSSDSGTLQVSTTIAPVSDDSNDTGNKSSGTLRSASVQSKPELKKFDADGTFEVGEKMLLSDLNFRPGSHYLRPSSIPSLRRLIDVLKANPSVKIEIIGHICCHPDYSPHPDGFDREAGDNKLSYNRANNIKDYLAKNGIDESRVEATGMGARERLVYPEETDQDRITNRRVEIKILSL